MVTILNQIYEEDFLGLSYGFRPGVASMMRWIEFGRFAEENRKRRGEGTPEMFDFLGFTHISGKTVWGASWYGAKRSANACEASCERSSSSFGRTAQLRKIPSLGPIRSGLVVALIQTPHRRVDVF